MIPVPATSSIDESHSTLVASRHDNTNVKESTRVQDEHFINIFIQGNPTYSCLEEIDIAVDQYEELSGLQIVIKRSAGYARMYFCASHVGCCFRAKFGKVRGTDVLSLKADNTVAFHCGKAAATADGRARKKRLKQKMMPCVDSVVLVKDGEPKAKDVAKAAANLGGFKAMYKQSYHAVKRSQSDTLEKHVCSFQLIVPYLNKFEELNPGSTTASERDPENNMKRLFICPGIMATAMKYVRPMMSLDAAHLKSQWRGTMYIASVKTASDKIYPVAFAIMQENENSNGWKWFLEHL